MNDRLLLLTTMLNLEDIFSQTELLKTTARYLSTLYLCHTALACSDLFNFILKSPYFFGVLKRDMLCDGPGLEAPKAYDGPCEHKASPWGAQVYPLEVEIEIRIWNVNCHDMETLPCMKRDINACEKCR